MPFLLPGEGCCRLACLTDEVGESCGAIWIANEVELRLELIQWRGQVRVTTKLPAPACRAQKTVVSQNPVVLVQPKTPTPTIFYMRMHADIE